MRSLAVLVLIGLAGGVAFGWVRDPDAASQGLSAMFASYLMPAIGGAILGHVVWLIAGGRRK